MNTNLLLIPLVVIAFVVFGGGALYTIDETQQVVVTQFGKLIGEPKSDAGLQFKLPFVQKANYFDKRILQWDGDPNQIPTLDKRYIWVDVTARWKITDALKFMQSVGNETSAQARLDDIIDASTREIISKHVLIESVRNSNRVVNVVEDYEDPGFGVGRSELAEIEHGRYDLSQMIFERAANITPNYGIELVDVLIKRINYVADVQRKVFERMISERKRAAEQYRSEGQGKRAEIEGQMLKELKEIESEAYRQAQEIKGKADAEAIKIYAEAYNKDPEFYAFLKSLETYEQTINDKTMLIFSTENDFYRHLTSVQFQNGIAP